MIPSAISLIRFPGLSGGLVEAIGVVASLTSCEYHQRLGTPLRQPLAMGMVLITASSYCQFCISGSFCLEYFGPIGPFLTREGAYDLLSSGLGEKAEGAERVNVDAEPGMVVGACGADGARGGGIERRRGTAPEPSSNGVVMVGGR